MCKKTESSDFICTLPRGGMYWVKDLRGARDFPISGGMYNPMHPESRQCTSYDHPLIINPSHGMYQEIHPYSAMNIGSFKINTSLMMIKE